VYFRWKRAGEPRLRENALYRVEIAELGRSDEGLRKLTEEEIKQAPPSSGDLSSDKKLTVFSEDGDIFIYDHAKRERRQLTSTIDGENSPKFTADQKYIVFTRQNNLYRMSLDGTSLTQLTDIRTGGGGSSDTPPRGNESQEYLKDEERNLIEAVRERAQNRKDLEAKRKQSEKRKPFSLPAGQSVSNLSLSPDGKYVIANTVLPASGSKNTIVPNYITESAYTEDISSRGKVGDSQTRIRMVVLNVETGESRWVDPGLKQAPPSQLTQKPEPAATAAVTAGGAPATPPTQPENQAANREVQISNAQWSEDGKMAAVLARATDNKDRWVLLLNPATGQTKVLGHSHNEAWVGGPGSFTLGWLPGNKTVYFMSESDGWAHLYTAPVDGGPPQQLTSGQFEVSDVRLSQDKTRFYFTSSEGSPFERHLYSMPITGGTRTRLTSLPGNNDATLSPDESRLAIVRSYSNKPPELYLAANRPGAEAQQITISPSPEFFNYNWIDPPIIKFKARDGVEVPARLYKPANFKKGGPAVLFVHGAGYLQNVHQWWSTYYREYMFHHLLMEHGYMVLDSDYRASAGYGRDWRVAIYRHMGGKDLSDQVDAAKYLVSEHGVDPKRIGIYGGSYGGFITLMALFTEPDVFAAGAALRPVTDWAHYNHGYTSNILNLPQNDAESYKRSSPIYFAQGLKGALLICHGMVDVNVHFQDTVRLAQRLIELRKENWELAVYPVEDHGFVQPSSWADEYRRIFKLFQTNLKGVK
ncbi:MAG TPA: prolyl oligopeptidase family serine peptidase, partial [Blastocatellia bacterium]|nr:prolyl oligopeptidase family serine peptidase [Blastocatellia bacterium]